MLFPGGNPTAFPNIGLGIGRPPSGTPYQFPESALWGGVWVGGNDNMFQCGRAEASGDLFNPAFYQHVAYAILWANSDGISPDSEFTLLPLGNFITDGDAGIASSWDFQKLAWGAVLPYRYLAPGAGTRRRRSRGGNSGLTTLDADRDDGRATLRGGFNLNAIALESSTWNKLPPMPT